MRFPVCLLALLLFHAISSAQSVQWVQRMGNIKSDKVTSVKTDGQGYIYIAGYFSNTLTLGTNALVLNYVANATSKEAFIAKLDSTGHCYWAKSGGAYFDDRVLGMDVDSAGNCVVTGTYWEGSGINFAPLNISGSGSGSGDQCFILKLDPNGTPLWGKFVCGNNYGDDQGLDVVVDKVGNIYTVGFMTNDNLICDNSTITAVNPNTGSHKHCYWITKMNPNGVFQWAKTFGNLPWDPVAFKYVERDIAVCTDYQGGIYITGGFDGANRQFGTSSFTSAGGFDIFVMKYDTSGNFIWATQGGSDKDDWSNGICSDKNGHIYITGEHRDSLIMDTVLVKNYDKRDLFIFKIDAQTGKPIWGKRAGGDLGGERGNDVWADENCNVYVTGDINENAKFGDNILTPTNGLQTQAFVARISPEGKWMWSVWGGGPHEDDRGNALAKGKGYQLYVGGFFRQSATFGSTTFNSAGSSDGFLMRIHDSMLNKGGSFNLNPPAKTVLCFGDTAHLKVPKHEYVHVTPTDGITFNIDSTELVFAPDTTTTYTIHGFSGGLCGEYDTISFTVSVGLQAFSLQGPTDTSLCPGEKIELTILPHEYFQVSPLSGATLNADESLLTLKPSSNTTYTLSGYIQGPCPTYDTVRFTVLANHDPVAEFDVTPERVLIDNPIFTLDNTSTGADLYEWYNQNNQLFSTDHSPSVTESALGEYCYTLVAQSLAGCVDTVTHCGEVVKAEHVIFPSAFTPDGDGRNDEFKPFMFNVDYAMVKDYAFIVVNRYGQVIFKSVQPELGWNGLHNGVKCDLGTYYYTCKFITPQGKKYEVKGDVMIMH